MEEHERRDERTAGDGPGDGRPSTRGDRAGAPRGPEDGTTLDADALPDMLEQVRAAGYTFVTRDALLSTEDRRRLTAG